MLYRPGELLQVIARLFARLRQLGYITRHATRTGLTPKILTEAALSYPKPRGFVYYTTVARKALLDLQDFEITCQTIEWRHPATGKILTFGLSASEQAQELLRLCAEIALAAVPCTDGVRVLLSSPIPDSVAKQQRCLLGVDSSAILATDDIQGTIKKAVASLLVLRQRDLISNDQLSDHLTAYILEIMVSFEQTSFLLQTSLDAAIPLHIAELKLRGGPSEEDHAKARGAAQIVAEKGDVLQFRSKKKGETAMVFNQLAFGLAVLSFLPGGVKFLGRHWESKITPDAPLQCDSGTPDS